MADEPIDLEMMNAAIRDFVPHNRALGLTDGGRLVHARDVHLEAAVEPGS